MMLLLDTHIWLWSVLTPEKLTRRVVRELEDPANDLWLSPISTWELIILCDKKKVVLNEDVETWIAKALVTPPLREAPLTHEIAVESRRVKLLHRDPADRFIAATAKILGLTLITADDRLTELKEIPVLANR